MYINHMHIIYVQLIHKFTCIDSQYLHTLYVYIHRDEINIVHIIVCNNAKGAIFISILSCVNSIYNTYTLKLYVYR